MKPQADHGEASYEGTGRLKDRRALITGADGGIGRAVALAFAREGSDVAISYLSEETDARETDVLLPKQGARHCSFPATLANLLSARVWLGKPSMRSAVSTFL